MKRVAKARILVTRFPYESQLGGEEMHTITLMCELDKKGHEAFFLGSCPVLLDIFKDKGFDVQKAWLGKPPVSKKWLFLFTFMSPYLFFKAGWILKNARKNWGVDTVYMLSFGEKLLMTPWAKFYKMKVIWLEHARIGRWLTKNPWRRIYKWWSKWVTTVVTSNAMVKHVKDLAYKVEAISCGVIATKPAPLNESIRRFLDSGFAVGIVARLTVDKGVDKVVRLVHCKPDMRLIVIGDGPLRDTVEKMLSSKQVMHLSSLPRPQLMSLYKHLDLLILGSMEMDPFGMVAAEAMNFGTPVLMTDVCGISEDLKDECEAVIVPAKYAALDKALKKLMKHKELGVKIGKGGERFVKTHYRLDTMVNSFEILLLQNSQS